MAPLTSVRLLLFELRESSRDWAAAGCAQELRRSRTTGMRIQRRMELRGGPIVTFFASDGFHSHDAGRDG